jgi:hypothetical protein
VDVVCQAVRLTGARVDLDLLAERVNGFVRAHEALRTTFEETDDGVRPRVHAHLPPRLVHARFASEDEAHAFARQLAHEPFDLTRGPLLRVALATGASAEESWLLVIVHNLVFDAWSFEMLLDELARASGAQAPEAVPFSRFAREQARWIESADGRTAATYWEAQVADPPPPLPADRPRDRVTSRSGSHVDFRLPASMAEKIAAVAKRQAATAFAGWLAVAWAAFAKLAESPDVLLGTFTAGRSGPGATETVGYLLNVVPVRLRDPGDGGYASRIRAAHAVSRSGLPHSAYPGELIDSPRRVPGAHRLFDAVFVFDNLGEASRTLQGARVTTTDLDKGTARYDLTLAVYPGDSGVTGWVEYDTDLYDESTARRLVERFTTIAEEASREAVR